MKKKSPSPEKVANVRAILDSNPQASDRQVARALQLGRLAVARIRADLGQKSPQTIKRRENSRLTIPQLQPYVDIRALCITRDVEIIMLGSRHVDVPNMLRECRTANVPASTLAMDTLRTESIVKLLRKCTARAAREKTLHTLPEIKWRKDELWCAGETATILAATREPNNPSVDRVFDLPPHHIENIEIGKMSDMLGYLMQSPAVRDLGCAAFPSLGWLIWEVEKGATTFDLRPAITMDALNARFKVADALGGLGIRYPRGRLAVRQVDGKYKNLRTKHIRDSARKQVGIPARQGEGEAMQPLTPQLLDVKGAHALVGDADKSKESGFVIEAEQLREMILAALCERDTVQEIRAAIKSQNRLVHSMQPPQIRKCAQLLRPAHRWFEHQQAIRSILRISTRKRSEEAKLLACLWMTTCDAGWIERLLDKGAESSIKVKRLRDSYLIALQAKIRLHSPSLRGGRQAKTTTLRAEAEVTAQTDVMTREARFLVRRVLQVVAEEIMRRFELVAIQIKGKNGAQSRRIVQQKLEWLSGPWPSVIFPWGQVVNYHKKRLKGEIADEIRRAKNHKGADVDVVQAQAHLPPKEKSRVVPHDGDQDKVPKMDFTTGITRFFTALAAQPDPEIQEEQLEKFERLVRADPIELKRVRALCEDSGGATELPPGVKRYLESLSGISDCENLAECRSALVAGPDATSDH